MNRKLFGILFLISCIVIVFPCLATAQYEYYVKISAAPVLSSGKQLNIYNYGDGETVTIEVTSNYSNDICALLFMAAYDEENFLVGLTETETTLIANSVNYVNFHPDVYSGVIDSIKIHCIDNETDLNTIMKAYTVEKTYQSVIDENAVCTAVSSSKEANSAMMAIDGDMSTYWCASTKDWPSWICVDLGESKSIDRIEFLPMAINAGFTYEILGSNDNSTWFSVAEHLNDKVYVNDESVIADNVSNCCYRYYNLRLTSGNWPALKELRLLVKLNE